jgi:uncharacterized DUF497 family protein
MTNPHIDIAWDPAKAEANLAKHGVAFSEAAKVLMDPMSLTVFDATHSQVEERWFTLGETVAGRLLAVSHTHVSHSAETATVRIISAREATRAERRQYRDEPR